jgi:hypothetical protein
MVPLARHILLVLECIQISTLPSLNTNNTARIHPRYPNGLTHTHLQLTTRNSCIAQYCYNTGLQAHPSLVPRLHSVAACCPRGFTSPNRHSLPTPYSSTMTRILFSLAALVAALTSLANAGITITGPKGGDKLTAGTSITVKWGEGGSGPAMADLLSYTLLLVVGGNEDAEQVSCSRKGKAQEQAC